MENEDLSVSLPLINISPPLSSLKPSDFDKLIDSIRKKSFLKFSLIQDSTSIDGKFYYSFSVKPLPIYTEAYFRGRIIVDPSTPVSIFSERLLDLVYKTWERFLENNNEEMKAVLGILRALNGATHA